MGAPSVWQRGVTTTLVRQTDFAFSVQNQTVDPSQEAKGEGEERVGEHESKASSQHARCPEESRIRGGIELEAGKGRGEYRVQCQSHTSALLTGLVFTFLS